MPSGTGDFYLYLHGEMRRESQTRVGDVVRLSIEFDHDYRNGPQHRMPEELEVERGSSPLRSEISLPSNLRRLAVSVRW